MDDEECTPSFETPTTDEQAAEHVDERANGVVHAEQHLTELLSHVSAGESGALDTLWRQIYGDVHAMARQACSSESDRAHVQPTLVVSELFLKVFGEGSAIPTWENRRHFWGSLSRAMGQFLVDRARGDQRLRRGGSRRRLSLEVVAGELEDPTQALSPASIQAIEALDTLEQDYPDVAAVARLRFLAGFSIEQTAMMLDIAPRTVSKRWNFARVWLRRAIATPV